MIRSLYITAIVVAACSVITACGSKDQQEEKKLAIDTHNIQQAPAKVTHSSSFDSLACIVLPNIDDSLDVIRMNAGRIITSHDSCVLLVIDSVADKFIRTHKKEYMISLDSIGAHSDGYVSEYFETICVELFIKALPAYMDYLYRNCDSSNRLVRDLKIGLNNKIEDASDSIKQKRYFFGIAKSAMKSIPSDQHHLLLSIVERIR